MKRNLSPDSKQHPQKKRRKRRTKKEMEEARRLENAKKIGEVKEEPLDGDDQAANNTSGM